MEIALEMMDFGHFLKNGEILKLLEKLSHVEIEHLVDAEIEKVSTL